MNFKYFPIVFLMMAGATVFGQKKEIRQAEKAIEEQNFAEAKQLLQEAEADVSSLNKKYKARFYTANGTVIGLGGTGTLEELEEATKNFEKAIEYGNKEEGAQGLHAVEQFLVQSAVQDQENQNYRDAYKKIYRAYEMSPEDTLYLFVAAGNAYNAQEDELAIEYYTKLKDMGYKGNALQYTAVNKETGEKEVFGNEADRDMFVQSGDYTDPQVERSERRDGDVIKQLALTHLRAGNQEKAIKTIKEARKKAPNDMELLKAEAIVYEESGDKENYLKILDELIRKDPENAEAYYVILGDNALEEKEEEKAREYYEKAIESNPKSVTAYNGIANSYLNKQEAIVEEMNSLGMSKADTEKYNKLSEDRNDLLKTALPYLEKALENAPESVELMQTLYQINSQLKNEEEASKYKSMMEKAGQ